MISFHPDKIFCDDAQEAAALGLFALMTGISEEFWCAGWMHGTEDALWRVQPGTGWGRGIITERQAQLLRLLSEECDGWWRWDDKNGAVFVRLAEWEASRR
jgi:hypothetical protein